MDTSALNFRFQLLKDAGTCDALLLQVISLLVAHVNENNNIINHAITARPPLTPALPAGGGGVGCPPLSSLSGTTVMCSTTPRNTNRDPIGNANRMNQKTHHSHHRQHKSGLRPPSEQVPEAVSVAVSPSSASSSSSCDGSSSTPSTLAPKDLVPYMAESMRILQEHLVRTTESSLQQYAADVGRVNDLGIAALEAEAKQWQEAMVDHVSQQVDAVFDRTTCAMEKALERRQRACVDTAAEGVAQLERRLEDLQAACRDHESQLEAYATFLSGAHEALLAAPLQSCHQLLTTSVFLEEEITCLASSAATRVQVKLLEERVRQLEEGKKVASGVVVGGGPLVSRAPPTPSTTAARGSGGVRHAGPPGGRRLTLEEESEDEGIAPAQHPWAVGIDQARLGKERGEGGHHGRALAAAVPDSTNQRRAAPRENGAGCANNPGYDGGASYEHPDQDEESAMEEAEEDQEDDDCFAITLTRPRKYL